MMKKLFSLILTLILSLTLFVSCGDSGAMNDSSASPEHFYSGGATEDNVAREEEGDSRKIIKTYNLSLETKRFAEDCAYIVTEAERLGGYISNSSVSGNTITSDVRNSQSASYTVRVPAEQADAYVALLSERCNVRSSTLTTEDITESYYGIRSQLESLLLQEQKLNTMLEQADSLSEIITLDDKLTAVRTQINALNYKLQNMEKSVDYSYIYISLTEVVEYQSEEKTYWQKFGQATVESFENFTDVIGSLLIVLVWIAPFALSVSAMAMIVLVVATLRKRKKKKDCDNQQP